MDKKHNTNTQQSWQVLPADAPWGSGKPQDASWKFHSNSTARACPSAAACSAQVGSSSDSVRGGKYAAVTVLISIPNLSRAPGHHGDAGHTRKRYLHSHTEDAPGAGGAGSLTQKPCVREWENSEKPWLDFGWVFCMSCQLTQQQSVGISKITKITY